MHIVILSRSPSLYSTARLALAARSRGHTVTVVDPSDVQVLVSRHRATLRCTHVGTLDPDVVVPRIGTGTSTHSVTVLRQFELLGVPSVNPSTAIDRCRDKLRMVQVLALHRISVPTTVCARSPSAVDAALRSVGGCPAIVRLQQGSQGIGTMIAETPQSLACMLETFWAMGQDIVLQQTIREAKGRDVRAVVVGGRVVAAMRRTARSGEFRAHLHRGAAAVGIELPGAYRACAIAAARAMALEVAGVDMAETRSGPKVLEITASPGLEGIERATSVDVARAIVAHAERMGRQRRSRAACRGRRAS